MSKQRVTITQMQDRVNKLERLLTECRGTMILARRAIHGEGDKVQAADTLKEMSSIVASVIHIPEESGV
jgi:cobyrinic acid a,c-diamide synthase